MSAHKTRIVYLQRGSSAGRIVRVRASKTGHTLYYGALELMLDGSGYKSNCLGSDGARYWLSNPRKDGQDTLYPGLVEIDDDVVDEYWREIRGEPTRRDKTFRSRGVHGNRATR